MYWISAVAFPGTHTRKIPLIAYGIHIRKIHTLAFPCLDFVRSTIIPIIISVIPSNTLDTSRIDPTIPAFNIITSV